MANSSVILKNISPKLTEDTLDKFLKDTFGKNVKLSRYNVESGSAKGDSYLSTVFRIKVEGTSENESNYILLPIIVKSLPNSIARRKTFRSDEFFRNEVAFYNVVVPELMRFQSKQNPRKPFTEFPRCFLASADGRNDIVVMEDMAYKMFKPVDRQDGLNYEKCCNIIKLLGRFHALSFAMKDKEPETFRKIASCLQETYYKTETKSWYQDQLKLFISIAIDAVAKELPDKMYEEKFRQFADETLFEKMCAFVEPREPFAVISHGDAWAPNFLLKYSSDVNEVEEICMIDYQLARYASPILDVSFFLYSCATREVMFSHFNSILDTYYKGLYDFILDLGSSPDVLFPYKDFQREVASFFAFGLGFSLESVPLSTLDEKDTPDVESIVGDSEIPLTEIWNLKPIENKEGRMRLAYNIKHAVDNDFL